VTLQEYLSKQGHGAKAQLRADTGLAYSTIHWIAAGRTRPKIETARAISEATGGAVSVAELLGLDAGDVRQRRKRGAA